ncbi:MAG TPA: class I SAM-dependent methyltransferase [Methylomirabilota bacterium]|jgi:2-polyprenyl-3-methyl-5-hydroxy-6-metoxy-1,4-benzoquinol methylase|nr:class I SAM-dependent methyltransferase [Methylomirabilota bacterium]
MTMEPFDQTKAAAFQTRMVDILNSSFLALAMSVGHHLGLFDMMAGRDWATSAETAEAARLQERYVREWLAAMVVGRIVEYNGAGKYRLPPEHSAAISREAGLANMANRICFVGYLGQVVDEVVTAFREGGGVPYSRYPRFLDQIARNGVAGLDANLLGVMLPLVENLQPRLRSGIDVLDVGCGHGHAINLMAGVYPASRFLGVDVAVQSIERAQAEAASLGLQNARFELRDAAALGEHETFDFITTFDAIHDQVDPAAVLRGIYAALRPGGTYLCVDIGGSGDLLTDMQHPLGPYLYTASLMHCMTVSLADGGAGLGTMWGEPLARRMFRDAGFDKVEVKRVADDPTDFYYILRK